MEIFKLAKKRSKSQPVNRCTEIVTNKTKSEPLLLTAIEDSEDSLSLGSVVATFEMIDGNVSNYWYNKTAYTPGKCFIVLSCKKLITHDALVDYGLI